MSTERPRPRRAHTGDGLFIVGLVGRAGSGKSTVARALAADGGAVIDADEIGHQVTDQDPEVRRALAAEYGERLQALCRGIELQNRPRDGAYSAYCVLLPPAADPAVTASRLAAAGIETRRWYYPLLHRHPAFADAAIAGKLDASASISGRLLGLPFHLGLDWAKIDAVARELARILGDAR
jgi:dTDP-4-amino-4,6-dideoxygalactose transaminase